MRAKAQGAGVMRHQRPVSPSVILSDRRRGLRSRLGGMGLTLLLVLGACGDSSPTDVAVPDPAVEPFVGNWDATEFIVTSVADESIRPMRRACSP